MIDSLAPSPPHSLRPEVLAPAGDWDCLRAAVENGADAVYFGLDVGFNARARAANFHLDDLPKVMEFLHVGVTRGTLEERRNPLAIV
jgi:putative protease